MNQALEVEAMGAAPLAACDDGAALAATDSGGAAGAAAHASSVSPRPYREAVIHKATLELLNGQSLLVVAGPGMGLSSLAGFVRDELRARGEVVALVAPTTVKQMLLDLCGQLGLDAGRQTTNQLQANLRQWLAENPAFLLFDCAHRLPVSIRGWLEELLNRGQPLLLLATLPPRKDLFLKLPRIELQPLPHWAIRDCLVTAGREIGKEFTPAQLAMMAERCGGNPMLARRCVREEQMGLESNAPDHTEWIDGTPLLIGALLVFTALRYIGRGLHSTDLYLLGGLLAVALGVFRLILYSLPRRSAKLGQ